MSFITALTHHLSSSHPSSLTSPSLCPPAVHSPLCPWLSLIPPYSGAAVPFCLVAVASLVLWLSHFLLLALMNLSPLSLCRLYPTPPPTHTRFFSPLSAAQASSLMDQHSCQQPGGFHGHIDTTDIPIQRSLSLLMPARCTQL